MTNSQDAAKYLRLLADQFEKGDAIEGSIAIGFEANKIDRTRPGDWARWFEAGNERTLTVTWKAA